MTMGQRRHVVRKSSMISEKQTAKKHEAAQRYLFQMSGIPSGLHRKQQRTASQKQRPAEGERCTICVGGSDQTHVRSGHKNKLEEEKTPPNLKRGIDKELIQEGRNANAGFVDLLILANSAELLESQGMHNVDKSLDATARIVNEQAEKDVLHDVDDSLDATDRIGDAQAEKDSLHDADKSMDATDRIGNTQAEKDASHMEGRIHWTHFRHQALMHLGLEIPRPIQDHVGEEHEHSDLKRVEDANIVDIVDADQVEGAMCVQDVPDISEPNELDDAQVSVHLKRFRKELSVQERREKLPKFAGLFPDSRREKLPKFAGLFPDSLAKQEDCIDKDVPYVPPKEQKKRAKRQQASSRMSKSNVNTDDLTVRRSSLSRPKSNKRRADGTSRDTPGKRRAPEVGGRLKSVVEVRQDEGLEETSVLNHRSSRSRPLANDSQETGTTPSGEVTLARPGNANIALPVTDAAVGSQPSFARFVYERRTKSQQRNKDLAASVTDRTRFAVPLNDGEGNPIHIDSTGMRDPVVGGGLLNRIVLPLDTLMLSEQAIGEVVQELHGDLYRANARTARVLEEVYTLQQELARLQGSTSKQEVDKLKAELKDLKSKEKHLEGAQGALKKKLNIEQHKVRKALDDLKKKDAEMKNKMQVITKLEQERDKLSEDLKHNAEIRQTLESDLADEKKKVSKVQELLDIANTRVEDNAEKFRYQLRETTWLDKLLDYHKERCGTFDADYQHLVKVSTPDDDGEEGEVEDLPEDQPTTEETATEDNQVAINENVANDVAPGENQLGGGQESETTIISTGTPSETLIA